MSTFKEDLAFGAIAESQIVTWLRTVRGYHVLPVYEKEIDNGKGPRLFTPTTELVAPDMLAIKGSEVRWIEAKHKDVWSWYGRKGYWVTGIDLHHYEQYCQVADTTPYPIWLLFLHRKAIADRKDRDRWVNCPELCPTGLFAQRLHRLRLRESHRSDKWANGMVYWAQCQFQVLATLEEVQRVQYTNYELDT